MICDRYLSLLVQHGEMGCQFLSFLIYFDDDGGTDEFDPFGRELDGKLDIDSVGYLTVDVAGVRHDRAERAGGERAGGPIDHAINSPVD